MWVSGIWNIGGYVGKSRRLLRKVQIGVDYSIGPVLMEEQNSYSIQGSREDTKGLVWCDSSSVL